jgi:hypothetical protein
MTVLSFSLVYFTNPGTIPDDNIWKIEMDRSLPEHIKVELFMCELDKRENLLINNKNIISEEALNESRTTSSIYSI